MSDINITGTVSTSQDYTNSYRNQMQESLIDAINILYKGAVAKENISKTLECVISDASERDKGIYKVDYMKNIFEVSCPLSTVYDVGDAVFVLVPDGDFSKTKIIVGSAEGNTGGSSGADVEANPAGTATDTLEKLRVGTTIYSIEGGPADAVTDVKVNGTSVVGSDHVARVSAVTQAQLEDALETKADASDLSALEGTVSDLTTTVNEKASQSSLEALATIVGTKANTADVNAALNLKADQSDLSDLITVVNGKANISDIPEIEANPSDTATGTLTKIDIDGTVYDLQAGSNYSAGLYIDIDNNNVINVNRVLPNGHVTYTFKTKSTGGYDATITITKESSGVVEQSRDYIYTSVRTPITIDDKFTFSYVNSWAYTLLEDTSDHTTGYTKSQGYQEVVDISETFVNVDRSGQTLVIKSEMDTALAGKQNTLTFDNVPTQNSDNPVKSGGVYSALANILDGSTIDSFGDVETALSGKADTSDVPEIEANPSDTATDTLTKIDIDGTVYDLAGGTTVVANPSGSATDELEKVQIGNTIYSLPSGGGTVETIIPTTEHATLERNSTAQDTYTATDDMYAIAVNLSINGEASSYTQTCSITTDGEVLDAVTNHQDTQSSPNRNYAIAVDSLNLKSGDDIDFINTGTATYIVRLRGVVGLNQEVRIKNEVDNLIVSDNTNNSRTVTLSPDKVYMVLAFGTSGNGGTAGDINVTSTGTITFTTLSAQSAKMICAFIVAGSSVTISFGTDTNYYSKGHIIYEVEVKKVEYATKEDLENYVVANPEDTPTNDISSIKIGDTVYGISGGGGSSTNYGKFKCDLLFNTPTSSSGWSNPITICTKSVVEEYDVLVLTFGVTQQETATILVADLLSNQNGKYYYLPTVNANGGSFHSSGLQINSNNDLLFYVDASGDYLYKVYGLKFENKLINRSDIYSEEERMIGRWTDGKPLYQKTIITTNTTINNWVRVDVSSLNIDSICDLYGQFTRYVNNKNYWYEFTGAENLYNGNYVGVLRFDFENGDGELTYKINFEATNKQIFTLQYTKTTDTPDSGVIPEDPMFISDPMIFSEEEQVVGRWTDGKPLYQKCLTGTISTRTSDWVEFGTVSNDVDTVIHLKSCFIYSDGSAIEERYITARYSNGKVYYFCENIGNVTGTGIIVIQYTKTTDSVLSGPRKGKIVQRSDIYSEEERLIGRQTDGKPLYQKVAEVNITSGTLNVWVNHDIPGLSDAELVHYDYDILFTDPSLGKNGSYDSTYKFEVCRLTTTQYYIIAGSGWNTGDIKVRFIIQYTKTTDLPFSKQLIEDPQFVMMSDIYSEEEQVVGRWTDGKPLYQKTYIFSSSIVINNQGVSIASYIDNLSEYDMVVNAIGYGIGISSTWCDRIYLDSTGRAWCAEGMTTHRVTVQYTKTTDSPGTGPTKGNLIYLPTLYSEEEREVGVWTDGKPLYQKTQHVGAISAGSNVRVSMPTGIDKVIDISGNAHSSNYSQWVKINFPHQNISAYIVTAAYLESSNEVNIYSGTDYVLDECNLTLQYTKTTDQPGSGTWTPEGQLAHHYSTSEKVVGTWIDGSTVYERTWDFGSNISVSPNSWFDTSIERGNINCIISYDAMASDGANRALDVACDSTYIQLLSMKSNGYNDLVRYLTLQYTKSS